MAFCGNCGRELKDSDLFCPHCGAYSGNNGRPADGRGGCARGGGGARDVSGKSMGSAFVDELSGYMGHNKSVNLNWKDLFSNVFKPHTREEAEEIFIWGTAHTTPPLREVSSTWPKPWLYSRVLVCFLAAYFLLYLGVSYFDNTNCVPGMIIMGSFAVPFATIILFMEVNAFRNISIYSIFIYFLIGGCASLLVTLFFFNLNILSAGLDSTWSAMMVGVIEECGKAVIVFALLRRARTEYILPALLIGACVGGGFSAFESAGYAYSLNGGSLDTLTSIVFLRAFLAPGGHVAWAAITAAAMVIAKGPAPLTAAVFTNSRFLKIFIIPIVLHGLWDAPVFPSLLKPIVLIVLVWIVVMILINMGLEQVSGLKSSHDETLS